MRSNVDECVFYRESVMYVLYTDNSILAGRDLKEVERAIEDIKKTKLDITIEGDIQDSLGVISTERRMGQSVLGVNLDRKKDGTIHLTQPHLIDQILDNCDLKKMPSQDHFQLHPQDYFRDTQVHLTLMDHSTTDL